MDLHRVQKILIMIMTKDVKRHSLLDNYWCYLYERQVKYYKHQTSNMKALCKSFTDRASLLHFTSIMLYEDEKDKVDPKLNFPCLSQQPLLLRVLHRPPRTILFFFEWLLGRVSHKLH